MTPQSALAFAVAVFLFAATPGPATLACVAQALGSGVRSALALAAGIVLGDVLFFLVAIYGLGVIASVLQGLFVVIRVAGGAYLVWMGWKMWMAPPAPAGPGREHRHAFRAGLLLTLGNPKVILFYLGFLPAFMRLDDLSGTDVVAAVVLLVCVLMTVNAFYAWTAARARRWMRAPAAVRRLNRGAGTVLMAAGTYVALKR